MAIKVLTMGLVGVEMPGQLEVEPGQAQGYTLRELLFDQLVKYDANLPDILVDSQGQLKPEYAILVDGRNATQVGGLSMSIKDGTTILITAMVSGG
jgi:molybdopterin converting factor small subunit